MRYKLGQITVYEHAYASRRNNDSHRCGVATELGSVHSRWDIGQLVAFSLVMSI